MKRIKAKKSFSLQMQGAKRSAGHTGRADYLLANNAMLLEKNGCNSNKNFVNEDVSNGMLETYLFHMQHVIPRKCNQKDTLGIFCFNVNIRDTEWTGCYDF